MNFKQFEQVLEVAKTGTFSQAARNLFISQPNLSLSVKQLEDELGCQLFVRTSEGVILTEDGKILLEHMAIIQGKYNAMKDYSKGRIPKRQTLRVGISNLNRVIPHLVKLSRKYAASPIHFYFLNYNSLDEIIDKVAACQLDIGIIGMMSPYVKNTLTRLRNHQLEYHRLTTYPIYAVVGPNNRFYHMSRPITMADLKTETLITFGNAMDDPYSTIFDTMQKRLEVKGRVIVNNGYLFYETIQASEIMGLISTNKKEFSPKKSWDDLRLIEISDFPITSETGWIKLRRMPLTDIAAELIDELNSHS